MGINDMLLGVIHLSQSAPIRAAAVADLLDSNLHAEFHLVHSEKHSFTRTGYTPACAGGFLQHIPRVFQEVLHIDHNYVKGGDNKIRGYDLTRRSVILGRGRGAPLRSLGRQVVVDSSPS